MRRIILLESGHRSHRRQPGASLASAALHFALVTLAVVATSSGPPPAAESPSPRRIYFATPPKPPAPAAQPPAAPARPPAAQPTRSPAAAVPLPAPPRIALSSEVPDALPEPGASLLDPSASSAAGEPLAGHVTDVGALHSGGAFGVDQVEEPAALTGQRQPAYPVSLARAGITGRVRARFVVGENGRVHGLPDVVFATSPEFEASVRAFLARARYRPARIGGRAVAQMVEQDFVFELRR